MTFSDPLSPVKHLYAAEPLQRTQALNKLNKIVAYVRLKKYIRFCFNSVINIS